MKVTVIPIVISALGAVNKGLVQRLGDLEISGRVETIKTTALLRSARILKSVLETWDLLSLRFQRKPSANTGVKNSQRNKIIIIIIMSCCQHGSPRSSLATRLYRPSFSGGLVRLTWIVFVTGGRWLYRCCFVQSCLQDGLVLHAVFLCNCRQCSASI